MPRSPKRHAAATPTTIPAITPGLKCPFVSGEFEFLFGEESLEVIAGEVVEEALVDVVEVRAGGVVAIFC